MSELTVQKIRWHIEEWRDYCRECAEENRGTSLAPCTYYSGQADMCDTLLDYIYRNEEK